MEKKRSRPKQGGGSAERRTLILWALLARENAAAFQNELKPEPGKADREALANDGLISSRKAEKGRIWIEVTDKGWHWAGEHLDSHLPRNSTAGSAILEGWLTRLQAFMRTRGFILADILGAQEGAAPAPAPISPPGPPDEATLRERVRQAYLDVTGGLFKTRALLSDVRSKLNDIDRATLDALLKRMQRDEQALLYQLDNRPEITDADREAAIYFGTEPRHILWIDQ